MPHTTFEQMQATSCRSAASCAFRGRRWRAKHRRWRRGNPRCKPVLLDALAQQPGYRLGEALVLFPFELVDQPQREFQDARVGRLRDGRGEQHQPRALLVDVVVVGKGFQQRLPARPIGQQVFRCEDRLTSTVDLRPALELSRARY